MVTVRVCGTWLVLNATLLFIGGCDTSPILTGPKNDIQFDPKVREPAFRKNHPNVLFDEAHHNYHTATGLYKSFVELVTNDGYRVTPNKAKFTRQSLAEYDLLLIANAQGGETLPEAAESAFTDAECDAVYDWVHTGGRLLVTDHYPIGAAMENMGSRFGVEMSDGYTLDEQNHEELGNAGWLVFSRENGLLGDHPIIRGRRDAETIRRVTTFMGQSLKGPEGSVVFLKLADSAEDSFPPDGKRRVSAAGRSQGLAFRVGEGRVVILGEAAVLSAQVRQLSGKQEPVRVGMTFPGSDNRQLALNTMHWLSGLLD